METAQGLGQLGAAAVVDEAVLAGFALAGQAVGTHAVEARRVEHADAIQAIGGRARAADAAGLDAHGAGGGVGLLAADEAAVVDLGVADQLVGLLLAPAGLEVQIGEILAVHDRRCDEQEEAGLAIALVRVLEQLADQRHVGQDRHALDRAGLVASHQAAEHDGVAVRAGHHGDDAARDPVGGNDRAVGQDPRLAGEGGDLQVDVQEQGVLVGDVGRDLQGRTRLLEAAEATARRATGRGRALRRGLLVLDLDVRPLRCRPCHDARAAAGCACGARC